LSSRSGGYRVIEERFCQWAESNEDVRAAVVIGSRARTDHPADEWSDLDVLVFADHHERYEQSGEWAERFAPVWVMRSGRTVMNDPEWLVLYAGGFRADFVIHPATLLCGLGKMMAENRLPLAVTRGVRVLIDRDSVIPPLPPPSSPGPAQPPSAETFRAAVEGFWFDAVYAAHQLCRKEMVPFRGVDAGLKWQLVTMMEWHARSTRGWATDTWHAGRFLDEWADPRCSARLKNCFAPWDLEKTWQAFGELTDLYRDMAIDTARLLGFEPRETWMAEVHGYLRGLRG
jgi:aminoglycoside 6-adenylyltransferase